MGLFLSHLGLGHGKGCQGKLVQLFLVEGVLNHMSHCEPVTKIFCLFYMLHLKYTPLELREPLISDSYETLKGTLYSTFIVWRFVGSSDGMMTHLISWVMVLLPLYYRRDRMTSVIALVAVLLGMIFGSRT